MKGTEGKTYYEVLGVERDATREAIRESYREIARVYHPDSNFYDEIVDQNLSTKQMEFFQLITDAYNTLSNENSRKAYDETLPKGLKDWEDDLGTSNNADLMSNNNTAKPLRNSGRYVFGDVRKTTILDTAFTQEVRPVSEMMYSKRYQSRQRFIIMLAVAMPFIAFGIVLYIYFTR